MVSVHNVRSVMGGLAPLSLSPPTTTRTSKVVQAALVELALRGFDRPLNVAAGELVVSSRAQHLGAHGAAVAHVLLKAGRLGLGKLGNSLVLLNLQSQLVLAGRGAALVTRTRVAKQGALGNARFALAVHNPVVGVDNARGALGHRARASNLQEFADNISAQWRWRNATTNGRTAGE